MKNCLDKQPLNSKRLPHPKFKATPSQALTRLTDVCGVTIRNSIGKPTPTSLRPTGTPNQYQVSYRDPHLGNVDIMASVSIDAVLVNNNPIDFISTRKKPSSYGKRTHDSTGFKSAILNGHEPKSSDKPAPRQTMSLSEYIKQRDQRKS